MKLILKEAMRSAEDGCLMDKEEITRVLYRLLETPAKEFPKEYISSLKEMLSCGLEWIENVSDEEFGEYTYLDLLCLTDITAYSLIVEDPNAMPSVLLLSEYIFLNFLQKTANYCTPADLFCAVNLKGLLNVLDELAGEPQDSFGEMINLAGRINGDDYTYNLTSKSTVKDLVVQTDSIIRQCWRPWHELRTFSYDVMAGYEIIHTIAFKFIKNAFSNSFRKWKIESDKRTNR